MTIPDLIHLVLGAIRTKFYADRTGYFFRDQAQLMKAITRWGYVCDQRGWDFTPQFILKEIMTVLLDMQKRCENFKHLPTYLHAALDRSVRQRAEELQAAARALAPKVTRIVRNAQRVEAIVEKGNTETLAILYADLAARQRQRRAKKPKAGETQKQLL